jgi:hypothetical protein
MLDINIKVSDDAMTIDNNILNTTTTQLTQTPKSIANEFCTYYYTNMELSGIRNILNLYTVTSKINYLNTELIGANAFFELFCNNKIQKIKYSNVLISQQVIDNTHLLINITGYYNIITEISILPQTIFSEVFIISKENNNYIILYQLFKNA